ncbi:MAG: TraB/GumN family protein [Aliishimia sp.]
MMIARFLTALALTLIANVAAANCAGSDLRPGLSAEERAELDTRVAATPYPNGNYWTATRGAQTIHVIGTIHLDDPRLAPMLDVITPVIQSANLLLVEATQDEQAKLEKAITTRPELLFLTAAPTLPQLMPEDDWLALVQAAKDRGLPAFMVAKFQPWYLSLMLSMPGCLIQQMATGLHGFDHQIMDVAAQANITQRSLEPYDTLFKLMGRETLERQIEYLSLGIMSNEASEDGLATLKQSYFEEKPAEVFETSRITARRFVDLPQAELDALMDELMSTLLDERNLAWMPAIVSAPDGVTVLAVGAAHLPGENGILNMLANQGFALKRQSF